MLIDTHAHLCDPEFSDELPALIERSKTAGVERIISIATTLDDARKTLELTRRPRSFGNGWVCRRLTLHRRPNCCNC